MLGRQSVSSFDNMIVGVETDNGLIAEPCLFDEGLGTREEIP